MSVAIFGSGGHLGSALVAEMESRGMDWLSMDYRDHHPKFPQGTTLVVNAAAFIPKPSVIACDTQPEATIRGNLMLPTMLAEACDRAGIPFAHLSTGCLWTDGEEHDEESPPQRGFGGHCGTYVGVKILAEEAVSSACEKHYIWRVRLPFDEVDNPRNYLSKLAAFSEVWDQVNSISHRADFAKAALDLWDKKAPWGTYHLVNPGSIPATTVVARMQAKGIFPHTPHFIDKLDGSCQLSVEKALSIGIKMRSADDAVNDAIARWTT